MMLHSRGGFTSVRQPSRRCDGGITQQTNDTANKGLAVGHRLHSIPESPCRPATAEPDCARLPSSCFPRWYGPEQPVVTIGMRKDCMKRASALVVLCVLVSAASAETKRDWQNGTWRDTDLKVVDRGSVTNGNVVGGSVTATTIPVRTVFQDFVIETSTHVYVARQLLKWRWSRPVPMTVNTPVRFALDKQDIYVIGEDEKEYKLPLVKKVLKTEPVRDEAEQTAKAAEEPTTFGSDVYEAGNGVTPPVPTYIPKPQYTRDAMRARIQGTVWVECVVQTSGQCSDPHVVRSLDQTFGLDQEGIKAARLFRFRPGTKDGVPVAVRVTIELSFTLGGAKKQ
jgi:TonB family protein